MADKQNSARARFEKLYLTIRDRICLLDYAPGTRLSEDELAEDFGVSRTPLRRVLSRLEDEGLVESRHGVGTFVTNVDFDELEEVYQLRMELAELIGRLKPLPRSAEDVERFRALLRECDRLIDNPDPKGFAQLNMNFFGEVAALIGNQHLRRVTEHYFLLTTRIWMTTVPESRLVEEVTIYRREIADVLTALEIGDLQAVGHINRSHLSMAFTRLRGYARQNSSE